VQRGVGRLGDVGDAIAQVVEVVVDRLERGDDRDVTLRRLTAQKGRQDRAAVNVIRLEIDRRQRLLAQDRVGDRRGAQADARQLPAAARDDRGQKARRREPAARSERDQSHQAAGAAKDDRQGAAHVEPERVGDARRAGIRAH
jgi:hypothetical protein